MDTVVYGSSRKTQINYIRGVNLLVILAAAHNNMDTVVYGSSRKTQINYIRGVNPLAILAAAPLAVLV